MERIAERIFNLFVVKKICDKNDEELYVYGLMLFLTTALIMLSVLILSVIFFELLSGILYILIFPALRVCVGGYHCKTYRSCFFASNFLFIIDVLLSYFLQYMHNDLGFAVTMMLLTVSSFYIVHNAPILNFNNPITLKRKVKNRKKAIFRTVIITTIAILCAIVAYRFEELKHVSTMAASVEVTVAVLMLVEKIIQKGERI